MGDADSPSLSSSSSDGGEHCDSSGPVVNGDSVEARDVGNKYNKRAPPKPKRKNVRGGANQRILLRDVVKERGKASRLRASVSSSAVLESIPEEESEMECVWGWIYVEKIPLVPSDLKDSNVEAFYQQLEVTMDVTARDLCLRYGFHGLCLQVTDVFSFQLESFDILRRITQS
jgi:hypothetical protein